jgi:hypothetical protein
MKQMNEVQGSKFRKGISQSSITQTVNTTHCTLYTDVHGPYKTVNTMHCTQYTDVHGPYKTVNTMHCTQYTDAARSI